MMMSTELYVLNSLLTAKLQNEAKHREKNRTTSKKGNEPNGNLKKDKDKPTKIWEEVFD